MRLAGAIWIGLIVGWLAWTTVMQEHRTAHFESRLDRADVCYGAQSAHIDSLEAYIGNLFVRVDRLEVLEGL